jgi:hypothetical protein
MEKDPTGFGGVLGSDLNGSVAPDRLARCLVQNHAFDPRVNVLHVGQQGLAILTPEGHQLK